MTAHEGTTGLSAAAATESPRVAGSRRIHIRCSSAGSNPVYAYWRFDDAHVRLPSHRLVLVINFCRFSSADVQPFAPQLLNVILAKIGVQNSPERTAENDFLMRCACAFSLPACWCLISCLSQVLRELSSPRSRLSSGSTLLSCRDLSTSCAKSLQTRVTRTLISTSSKAYPVLSGSSALPCRTRSPFLSLRSSLRSQKSYKRT